MKNRITSADLAEINAVESPGCVSMYIPAIKYDSAHNPMRIVIKNMLHEAKLALEGMGVEQSQIDLIVEDVRQYIDEYEIRPLRNESLVLFVNPSFFRHFHVPDLHLHFLMVGTRFNTSPISTLLANNKPFYLLSLAHKHVRLYLGDQFGLRPLSINGLSTGMMETLRIDEFNKSRETHPIAPAYLGKGSRSYHQQYDVTNTDKTMLLEFFRIVNTVVIDNIGITKRPLIIAGTERIVSTYKEANTYPYLMSQVIAGNQEKADMLTLKEKAMQVLYS
jgi:hypothetical protein